MKTQVIFQLEKITEEHRQTTIQDIKRFYPKANDQELKELLEVFTTYNKKTDTIGG